MEKNLQMKNLIESLPIGDAQIRIYLKEGRLKGKKIRNKWYVQPEDFQEFKQAYGF